MRNPFSRRYKVKKPTTPSEVLVEAGNLIDYDGWARSAYKDERGRYCAVGAIRQVIFGTTDLPRAAHDFPLYLEAQQQLAATIKGLRPEVVYSTSSVIRYPTGIITTWNDLYSHSLDEVVNVFTLAAEEAMDAKHQ